MEQTFLFRRGDCTIYGAPPLLGWLKSGSRPDVIELAVNYISGSRGGIAGVYNRSELLHECREALERWARHLAGVVAPQPNVVSLSRNRSK